MRVLGIDPSLARTGWALVEWDKPHPPCLVWHDHTPTSAREPRTLRLFRVMEGAHTVVIHASDDDAGACAFERGMAYSRVMATGALAVAEARGVILAAVGGDGLKAIEVSPASAKKAVTGNGKASKADVRRAVQRIFGLPAMLKEDESDAAAVALAALGYAVESKPARRAKGKKR